MFKMRKRSFLKTLIFSPIFLLNGGIFSSFFKNNFSQFKKVKNKGSVWILSKND